MAYQALYRAWRPQDFRGLIGQEHISKTLQSALAQDKIGHAYLFSGTRGTGKTSTAKILAKAVNCHALNDGQPCGQCESCLAIASGNSMDVLEIDAASNRGIEEIRELKEKINFIPVHGKYKVYIIDEVHMLTTEAFNALLKTLEEPPSHVIFILATTEAHKLPATILSRCQRFDFRRIPLSVIEEHLQSIAASMKLDLERAAAALIAKKADGSLRDAISLLDQCVSLDQSVLTAQTVYHILGLARQEVLGEIAGAMADNRGDALLTQVNALIEESVEPMQILKDVMEYFRNLMMLKICGDQTELVAAVGEDRDRMLTQSHRFKLEAMQRVIGRLSEAESDVRWRGNVRFMLESLLVELMIGLQPKAAPERKPEAEKTEPGFRVKPGMTDGETPRPKPEAGKTEPGFRVTPGMTNGETPGPKPEAGKTEPGVRVKPGMTDGEPPGPTPEAEKAEPGFRVKPGMTDGETPGPKPEAGKTEPGFRVKPGMTNGETPGPKPEAAPPEAAAAALSPSEWAEVLDRVRERKKTLHAFLTAITESRETDGTFWLVFKGGYLFHKEQTELPDNKKLLEEILTQYLGRPIQVRCLMEDEKKERAPDPVQKAIDLLGPDMVTIKKE
ncbi:MAG: DNA polymerase III subunit gamma/tau [Peptococcaceae bacterium]|jgi:DNA polymerase-3 subunit gamma/tau|nr:DNA polymerase III subunit gamma/tau [Peptococcaceae bacterium]